MPPDQPKTEGKMFGKFNLNLKLFLKQNEIDRNLVMEKLENSEKPSAVIYDSQFFREI